MARSSVFAIMLLAAGDKDVVTAQGSDVATIATHKPRFLAAWSTRGKLVDVSNAVVFQRRVSLDVDDVPLATVLRQLAQQARIDLSYASSELPERLVSLHVRHITMLAALTEVLVNTGLDVVVQRGGQITLEPAAELIGADRSQTGQVTGTVTDAKNGTGMGGVDVSLEGTPLRTTTGEDGRYRIADVPAGGYTLIARRIGYRPERRTVTVTAREEAAVDVALQPAATQLAEVVVTTQKREERLINVPQSVTVVAADELAKLGATQFRDFASTVPGLSFNTAGAGFNQITLRGVAPTISSTVGIYVDEVPYGSSSAFTQSNHYSLDAGLFDLDRIEVLRGPQGTLYGASTMGGLLKYVTQRPDATRWGTDLQAGTSGTRYGSISYNGAAAVNAPLMTDKLALRATGFYSRDGGYIDNVALGEEDVNRSAMYGGRADLMFTPTEALSVRATAFLQNLSREGWATADYTFAGAPEDGSVDQRRPYDEPFDQRFRLVSGTITYDLGTAALTSISSYQTVRTAQFWDFKHLVPIFASIGLPFSAVGTTTAMATDKFTQEVRLAAERSGPLEWLVGAFYTHETSGNEQAIVQRDLTGQPSPMDLFTGSYPSRYEEYAAFGNVTWYLSDQFDVSGGVRYAENRQRFEEVLSGIFTPGSHPSRRASENVVTYLANARYRFSDQATGYLRYATGYRPGGPNFFANDPTTGLRIASETFESDRLKSYEAGIKAEAADRRFGIDVAGYYNDWTNMQIGVLRGGFAVFGNAPGGVSVRGGELTLSAHPTSRLTVTGAFAYQDAELSEADPDLGGAKGERLPNVPRFTGAVNADYDLPSGSLQPTIGATLRYVDDRTASFIALPDYYRLPDYTTVDLRTGLVLNRANVQIYVHNLFDERGPLSVLSIGQPRVAILQPRTIGVTVTRRF